MRFRPCIDIHNGCVKQIIGGSLTDKEDHADENFVSTLHASDYAKMYAEDCLTGGHVILLNATDSPFYEATRQEACSALSVAKGKLQVGGGISPENAAFWLEQGASQVIVTSYLYADGCMQESRLREMTQTVGRDKLVLDLSCRKKDGSFFVVTNRWQTFTSQILSVELLQELSTYCSEFLIHGVDVEGKQSGIDEELMSILGEYEGNPITYAGGIHKKEDLERIRSLGKNKVDYTIGSALDLFGGTIPYKEIVSLNKL